MSEREDVAPLAEVLWDQLDAQHDNARHIHASECCWSFLSAADCERVVSALLAAHVERVRAEAWDEGWDERDGYCSEPYSPPKANPYSAALPPERLAGEAGAG